MRESKIMTIILATGKEDGGLKASIGLSAGVAAVSFGFSIIIFLTGNGIIWGSQRTPECMNIGDLLNTIVEQKGKLWVCSACHKSCGIGATLHKNAEIVGFSSLIPHLVEGPHLVF